MTPEQYIGDLEKALPTYGIADSRLRLAHFFAQIGERHAVGEPRRLACLGAYLSPDYPVKRRGGQLACESLYKPPALPRSMTS